jgi:hypothetical protein
VGGGVAPDVRVIALLACRKLANTRGAVGYFTLLLYDLYHNRLKGLIIVLSRIKIIFWNVGTENVYFWREVSSIW